MRFLVDECSGPKLANWLHKEGHEVFSVYHSARGISDDEVIEKAFTENWILIINDKDFGEKRPHRGVIFLRLEDERAIIKIETIKRLLKNYNNQIADNFSVVTETKVRFARISRFKNNYCES